MTVGTGGPAFPSEERIVVVDRDDGNGMGTGRYEWKKVGGMTLRDWFAGQALMGFLAYSPDFYVAKDPEDLAVRMYAVADAMIKERAK